MKTARIIAQEMFIFVFITALVFIVYWPVLTKVGFVSDDFFWKPFFAYSFTEMMGLITAQLEGEIDLVYFRPIVVAGYQLDYAFWGDNPFGYHLTNLSIHSANAIMLYALCRTVGLDKLIALMASLIFAVYPGHSETVTWISGRADLLALFFLLTAMLLWCKARVSKQNAWFIFSAIAFVLAVMSKEVAAAGILIFPAMDWCLNLHKKDWIVSDGKQFRHWRMYGVFLLIILFVIAIRFWLFGDIGGHTGPSGRSKYFEVELPYLLQNISADLTILFTPVSRIVWADSTLFWRFTMIASGIIIVLYLIALFYSLAFPGISSKKKILTAACLLGTVWIISMLIPVIPLLPVSTTLLRTRFLYSPSCGLALIIGLAAGTTFMLSSKKVVRAGILAGFLIILIASIHFLQCQNQIWQESSTISEQVNSVIITNTQQLEDKGTVVFVNIPEEIDYKGIECIPVITPAYFNYLYSFTEVKVIFTSKEKDQIPAWWADLKESKPLIVGFICDEDLQSMQPLL